MTEVEKIEYARTFIEKLANGTNPLTGEAVPDAEVINNVRISRCLFYVSDILRQVVENGGVLGKKGKLKKLPFNLSHEERQKFQFSETPVTITALTGRINDLIDSEVMSKLRYSYVSTWLTEIGFLTVITTPDGRNFRRPTERGREFGISTEQRYGENGMYTAVLYNRAAQQFIIDNLDAVIEVSKRPREKKKETDSREQQS